MANFPKEIADFMAKHKVSASDVWAVPGGKSYAVKHKALERIAAEIGIKFDRPAVLEVDAEKKLAAFIVFASLGDREEWSVGEAAPGNCKNAYTLSMAEKRGKDRCILKLLNAHGDIYSEDEFDGDKRQNPHVTRSTDIFDGEVSDDIPDVPATKMKVKDARPQYSALLNEMHRIRDPQELFEWGAAQAETISSLPGEWPQHFRGEYTKHKQDITRAA